MDFLNKLIRRNKTGNFLAEELKEQPLELDNPSRGWYRIVHYEATVDPAPLLVRNAGSVTDGLELVTIGISGFPDGPISGEAIGNIKRILQWYKDWEREIILRISYDHEGKAPEREPFFFKHVLGHITQVGEAIAEYADSILVYQGLLVGNWGEMHTSRFLDPGKLKQLSEALQTGTGGKIPTAVRKPVQWRMIHLDASIAKTPDPQNCGFFDDAILGSMTDMGTYGDRRRENARWDEPWCKEDELAFLKPIGCKIPVGGEVVAPPQGAMLSLEETAAELKKMQVTYLNAYHDPVMLNAWREQKWEANDCWKGVNGFRYIGAHLGYRYVVTGADSVKTSAVGQKSLVTVTIANVGFAGIYRPVSVCLEWQQKNGTRRKDCMLPDLRTMNGRDTFTLTLELENAIGDIFLSMENKHTHKICYFANVSDDRGRVKLGRIV